MGSLHESENEVVRRSGVTTQLWLVCPFLEERLALGVSAGGD